MMRLCEPVTREAIIRSYTPISEGTDRGTLDVLVKVYLDTADRPGGRMTKALNAVPTGKLVDFKSPVGKFEYKGKGVCEIGGQRRSVKNFIMICGGTEIAPIVQVLRAVLKDREDPTKCLVLDGNRLEEDILCRGEMEALVEGNAARVMLLHALTQPTESWTGLRGRVRRKVLEEEVGACEARDGEGWGGVGVNLWAGSIGEKCPWVFERDGMEGL